MKLKLIIPYSRDKCATIRAPVGATPIGGATAASNTTPESANANNSNIVIKPQFNSRWKMFELDAMDGCGRVCLVFPPKPDPPPMNSSGSIQLDLTPTMPQVWLLDRAYDWHYLATNFTSYFRMMLYHLGLPQWQLLFTPMGPTPWAKVSLQHYLLLLKNHAEAAEVLDVHDVEVGHVAVGALLIVVVVL